MRADHKAGRRFVLAATLVTAPLAAALPAPLAAQEAPLRTADPAPLPHGILVVEIGAEYLDGVSYPLSGLSGDLLRAPVGGFRLGVGGIAELQLSSGYNVLFVDDRETAPFSELVELDGDLAYDIEDPVASAKLRLASESRWGPATGLRAATRLPSAGQASGLGNDTIDFLFWVLMGKTIGGTRLLGNLGLGVLSLPEEPARQNDVLLYGIAASRPVGERWTVLGEIHGRYDTKGEPPPGTDDQAQARLGFRWRGERLSAHGAVVAGLHETDPGLGAVFGVAWAHRAYP